MKYVFIEVFIFLSYFVLGQNTDEYKTYIEKNLGEYDKLEELQIRSLESQTGVKDPDYKNRLCCFGNSW